MEKQLNFVLKLSLKEIALRKLVALLWNENDVLNVIENNPFIYWQETFDIIWWQKTVEVRVKDKVSKLKIPKSLKEQMMCFVRPIGLDIVRWKRFHENFIKHYYFDMHILKQLEWSCIGVIDYQKTAEKLVCLEIFDIVKRYRLACFYCLVDHIPLLWKKLDEESRMQFYGSNSISISGMKLENIWSLILKGEESVLDEISRRNFSKSINQSILISSACIGNKAAIKHFFPLLTTEEQHSTFATAVYNLMDYFRPLWPSLFDFLNGRLGDVLCYILSMMRPEEQIQLFRRKPYHVLCCFLDWPYHDLFVDLTNLLWNSLPEGRCLDLLLMVRNCKYSSSNLLQKLFLSGPSEWNTDFVTCEYRQFAYLSYFFYNQDTEGIKVVLRHLNASDRVDLVSQLRSFEMFNDLMETEGWHLVELCFREAIQTKEDTERLKTRFIKVFDCINTGKYLLRRKREWEQFIELLDVADTRS